eukprot:scaffold6694_cov33-Phaeocystis_antarctica.AAC.3
MGLKLIARNCLKLLKIAGREIFLSCGVNLATKAGFKRDETFRRVRVSKPSYGRSLGGDPACGPDWYPRWGAKSTHDTAFHQYGFPPIKYLASSYPYSRYRSYHDLHIVTSSLRGGQ